MYDLDLFPYPKYRLQSTDVDLASSLRGLVEKEIIGKRLEFKEDYEQLLKPCLGKILSGIGLQKMFWPERFGGDEHNRPAASYTVAAALEQIGRADLGVAALVAHNLALQAALALDGGGSEEACSRLAPLFCEGDRPVIVSFVLPAYGEEEGAPEWRGQADAGRGESRPGRMGARRAGRAPHLLRRGCGPLRGLVRGRRRGGTGLHPGAGGRCRADAGTGVQEDRPGRQPQRLPRFQEGKGAGRDLRLAGGGGPEAAALLVLPGPRRGGRGRPARRLRDHQGVGRHPGHQGARPGVQGEPPDRGPDGGDRQETAMDRLLTYDLAGVLAEPETYGDAGSEGAYTAALMVVHHVMPRRIRPYTDHGADGLGRLRQGVAAGAVLARRQDHPVLPGRARAGQARPSPVSSTRPRCKGGGWR